MNNNLLNILKPKWFKSFPKSKRKRKKYIKLSLNKIKKISWLISIITITYFLCKKFKFHMKHI